MAAGAGDGGRGAAAGTGALAAGGFTGAGGLAGMGAAIGCGGCQNAHTVPPAANTSDETKPIHSAARLRGASWRLRRRRSGAGMRVWPRRPPPAERYMFTTRSRTLPSLSEVT